MNEHSIIMDNISTGEENVVSLAELCRITGIENRELRAIIAAERLKGAVICSSVNGYFYPETVQELQAYVHQERARSRSISQGLKSAEILLKKWNNRK